MRELLVLAGRLPARCGGLTALMAALCLTACSGGGSEASSLAESGSRRGAEQATSTTSTGHSATGSELSGSTMRHAESVQGNQSSLAGTTHADAFRLLTQATFGPTDADLSRATSLGAEGWVDEQLAIPFKPAHLSRWLADDAEVKSKNPRDTVGSSSVVSSFYQQALQADDQLRQRVAFALSEIFVVSLAAVSNESAQSVAAWNDMLGKNAFGNFRTLLQDVATHPAMGMYLSHMKNRKEDLGDGRVPDQNFAREVMQLFTIGLVKLRHDGSPKLDEAGHLMETYTAADIAGMASVFTGFSWAGPDTSEARFKGLEGARDPQRMSKPMQGYPQYHSTAEKRFLNAVVPAQATADPQASLQVALDTLFAHRNVGPFIGRQLIQRLVTSAPSPGYVARVGRVFNDNGNGVRGDMKAVVRAVLLDNEARSAFNARGATFGKVREPVLRLTAYLRAFSAKSESRKVLMSITDDPGTTLAQTPLRSPSVFNFFRPGYIPAGGEASALGMTVPEMQITNETTVAGYANYMLDVVQHGVGPHGSDGKASKPDLQVDFKAYQPLAETADLLVDQINARLLGDNVNSALRAEQVAAVTAIEIPPVKKTGGNTQQIERAKASRVLAAVSLALVCPEFIVQK
jgi:uncharacterized protein (DUF1800 family)